MTQSADRVRQTRSDRAKPGAIILRALLTAIYGAALAGGLYTPDRAFRVEAVALLLGFIAYFLWRIHAVIARPRPSDLQRVEVGLLAVLALATVLAISDLPLQWHTAAYGVLLVGLAASVSFPSILALPLATVTLWGPLHMWLARVLHLEVLTAVAGLVAVLEGRRRKRLATALKKIELDVEHLGARAQGAGAAVRVDLGRLDDVLYDYLQEVKQHADAHGALLGVKTPRGELFVRELVSDSFDIRDEAVLNLDGTILQWILEHRKPLRIGSLQDPSARLGYYAPSVPVRSFLGVPLIEGSQVEGVLAVDSLHENAFSDTHLNMLRVASHQVVTILDQIQALEGVKREARDFQHLHEFSKRLSACGSLGEVLEVILDTLRARIQPDFSAVALLDPEGQLALEAVGEPAWTELKGRPFDPSEGLAGWVLASRQYLHYPEGRRGPRRPLLGEGLSTPEFPSLLLHPLEVQQEAPGVLCLGCREPGAFDQPALAFCEVIARQGARAILQLRTLEQLQALAATDGLTGLANRRVFFARLTEEVSRWHRYGQPLTLLLLDLDHFKGVNDRHGHPAGDEVLRATARVLRDVARATDLVCRYGGEEFAVLAPSTDQEGALALAERFRAGVEGLSIEWQGEGLAPRVSVGVAHLEGEADTVEGLIARTDQALYAAKEQGRNRVVAFSAIRGSPPRSGEPVSKP